MLKKRRKKQLGTWSFNYVVGDFGLTLASAVALEVRREKKPAARAAELTVRRTPVHDCPDTRTHRALKYNTR